MASSSSITKLMLKDHLRDDLSSCSSAGFDTFPRNQCCSTVRFLLELDLKSKTTTNKRIHRSKSGGAAVTAISALQRASVAVLKAVKLLPISSSDTHTSKGLLRRSFSRKLLRRRFWKKNGDEKIGRLKFFHEFLDVREPVDQNSNNFVTTTTPVISSARNSMSTSSECNSNSNGNSWSVGESSSENSSPNDVVDGKKELQREAEVSNGVSVTVADEETTFNRKEWKRTEEKEQLSPVCVLDCPFEDDDDEEISSPFCPSLTRIEERKQKLMHNIRRFEKLAQLEPVNLSKRIELSELDRNDLPTFDIIDSNKDIIGIGENEIKRRADELLKLMISKVPFASDNAQLLLDFFAEKLMECNHNRNADEDSSRILKEGEDWLNGEQEFVMGWEEKETRIVYVNDLEKSKRLWTNLDHVKQEIASQLEFEIFTSFLVELLENL